MVDPVGAVLLISGRDPASAVSPQFWLVPGGGARRGETVEDAARREIYEEVGARLGELGPVVWRRHVSFEYAGCWYEQSEWFFVARTSPFTPRPVSLTSLERRSTTGARWWGLDELASCSDPVYPRELVALVAQWLTSGPPPAPLQIE